MNNVDLQKWDVFSAQVNVKVPFNLSGGKYYRSIQPQVSYSFNSYIPRTNYSSERFSGSFQTISYRLFGYNAMTTSLRDINPRWGQTIDVRFNYSPLKGANIGNIFAVETMWYFPGIGKHHSLGAYVAYQQINPDQGGNFSDIIAPPQGVPLAGWPQMLSMKFSYEFPLFYPDWSIWSALYIQRFRAALYYDQGFIMDDFHNTAAYNSVGAALLSDLHILRFLAPITLGCRATYTFYNKAINYMVVYNINFNQLYFKPKFSRMND
jgi:hypothetical protein